MLLRTMLTSSCVKGLNLLPPPGSPQQVSSLYFSNTFLKCSSSSFALIGQRAYYYFISFQNSLGRCIRSVSNRRWNDARALLSVDLYCRQASRYVSLSRPCFRRARWHFWRLYLHCRVYHGWRTLFYLFGFSLRPRFALRSPSVIGKWLHASLWTLDSTA